jgi:Rrf2 family iron-sulfur cluster assembly transcriptional regulator
VSGERIAAGEGLSGRALARPLKALARAGVLTSATGPGGGYRLARPARSISLLEIVEAIDGPVRGKGPGVGGAAGHRLDDRLQRVCNDAAGAVRRRLRQVSLADLAGGEGG